VRAREQVRALVEHKRFQRFIIGVIIVNAVTLGLETSPSILATAGGILHAADRIALAIFVIELLLRLYAHGWRFFKDPWSIFDLIIVSIALIPATGPFSVLRALRVLRVLRLISMVPAMRRVVSGLLASVPGMASIGLLLGLVLYVAGVMATKLFGGIAPQYFGDLGTTLFTLFQTMTGEAWPEVARTVMAEAPMAWIFFVTYILVSTFAVLNLFIAVIVSGMERGVSEDLAAAEEKHAADQAARTPGSSTRSGPCGRNWPSCAPSEPAIRVSQSLPGWAGGLGPEALGDAAGQAGEAASGDGVAHGGGHAFGVVGSGDRGGQEDGRAAQFHCQGGIRRGADAGVEHDGDAGAGDDQLEVVGVADAQAGADRRAEGHDGGAPGFLQAQGQDRVVVGVGQDGEAVGDQGRGGVEQFERVGQQGAVVGDHFEFDPVGAEGLAGQAGGEDRLGGGVAAGGVGERVDAEAAQDFEDAGAAGGIDAADRHRRQLGARGDQGAFEHGQVGRATGSHDQPRRVLAAGDEQRVVHVSLPARR
jgi:voltage-gated sodium channel